MKFTIEGFSQRDLVIFDMDPTDAVILRWFIDFKDSGKMFYQIIDGEVFYWLKYKQVVEDLPCIKIEKKALQRRFKKMSDSGVLDHITIKKDGTFSYYKTGKQFIKLIDFEVPPSDFEVPPWDFEVPGGGTLKSQGWDSKVPPNYSSIKDSSIKDTKEEKDNISIETLSKKKSLLSDDDCDEIYKLYPKKQGKADGYKGLKRLKVDETTKEDIIKAVKAYKEFCKGKDPVYIKMFSSWINQRCWEDDLTIDNGAVEFKNENDYRMYDKDGNPIYRRQINIHGNKSK